MKRIFSILMLAALIIPFWGIYSLLNFQINKAADSLEDELETAIRKTQFVLLSYSSIQEKSEFRMTGPGEFEYQDKMYDIVQSGMDGNTTWFLCFYHQKETHLRYQFSKLIDSIMGHHDQQSDKTVNLVRFLQELYFNTANIPNSLNVGVYTLITPFLKQKLSMVVSPLLPPPK